jgi:protein SCO1
MMKSWRGSSIKIMIQEINIGSSKTTSGSGRAVYPRWVRWHSTRGGKPPFPTSRLGQSSALTASVSLPDHMPTKPPIPLLCVITIGLLLALSVLSGCRRDASNAKRYEFKGKVMSVEKDKHLVTVSHEEIKGFMDAMTMPFMVRDEWVFDQAAPGDQITATLVVDETESWLENVIIINTGPDSGSGISPQPPGTSNRPAGVKGSPSVSPQEEGVSGAGANTGDEVPDFALVNQNNQPIRTRQYKGKALLLTFIYTRCPIPEYCTLMSNNFSKIDEELQKQPELYEKTRLLSITIDPEYDTPAVLRSYGSSHTGRYGDETFSHWAFATGTKEQVKEVAQFFGLQYYPEQDQIIHGLRTAIIAPDGKVAKVYRGNEWKPEEVLKDIEVVSR